MYLLERGPKDLVELTTWAQQYLIADKKQLGGKTKSTVQLKRAEQRKPTQSKLDTTQGRQRSIQCYKCQWYGHRQSECLTKASPGKNQKSWTHVVQSNQKKTHAMVARSNEDGEEAFMCMNVERPRSSGNSKKSNSNRLTSDDEAICSATCRAQSNDGQNYIEAGKLNGWPVKVLRDTECTGMTVDRALISDSMVIPGSSGSLQMVDHTLIDVPLANIYLDSPYYKEHCKVMCVSFPVYPVIIGNVKGACQMLPDPEWKAKDQRGARVRTSGCNKNDDDNQGGDMPSWSPTEEKLRIETHRRSQPRSRKMITVLHKMSKSKEAPQKESVLLDHV